MGLRDYILCGECETKLVYDGNDEAREWLEERYGDPSCNCYTVKLLCPTCLATLRTQNAEQAERIWELEGKNDGFNELTGLMQKSLEEDTTRIGELFDENQQLRAALVRARSQALYDAADDFESGASASDIRANADALLSGQPDGPGEEDGPWAAGWKERCGQPVEDPRDAKIASLQAKIDALMLEYCPDEITLEQMEEWASHQVVCAGG